jgi:hypothetical protein
LKKIQRRHIISTPTLAEFYEIKIGQIALKAPENSFETLTFFKRFSRKFYSLRKFLSVPFLKFSGDKNPYISFTAA